MCGCVHAIEKRAELARNLRVSVRPRIFLYAKNTQNLGGNRAASASVYFNGRRPAIVASGTGCHGWVLQNTTDPSNSDKLNDGDGGVWVCARVRAGVRVCVRACMMCLQYTIIIFAPG